MTIESSPAGYPVGNDTSAGGASLASRARSAAGDHVDAGGGTPGSGYQRDGARIYRESFAIIRAEADLSAVPADLEPAVGRMIHACGMTDLPADLTWSPGVGRAARQALADGAPVLCDSAMVADGITRSRLPAGNRVICTLRDPGVPELAARLGTTRSAAAVERWRGDLAGGGGRGGQPPPPAFPPPPRPH